MASMPMARGYFWSIPARAGEPPSVQATVPTAAGTSGLSPRVRGNHKSTGHLERVPGLSPRVRGNRIDEALCAVGTGSIPARAGEPRRPDQWTGPRLQGLSPRVRGNRRARHPDQGGFLQGLSPRVRGNRSAIQEQQSTAGSIPARAGEPYRRSTDAAHQGSIPARAGEPTEVSHRDGGPLGRSIPARAGEPPK